LPFLSLLQTERRTTRDDVTTPRDQTGKGCKLACIRATGMKLFHRPERWKSSRDRSQGGEVEVTVLVVGCDGLLPACRVAR